MGRWSLIKKWIIFQIVSWHPCSDPTSSDALLLEVCSLSLAEVTQADAENAFKFVLSYQREHKFKARLMFLCI